MSSEQVTVPRNVEARGASAFRLKVVRGSDVGASLLLDGQGPPRALVGQSPTCDLRLSDPLVSRRHLAVELIETGLRIEDAGSTNGTTVNGVRVESALLSGGELIALGDTALGVERLDEEQKAPASAAMHFGGLLGQSPEMRRVYALCERLAPTNVSVVIEGETGTGKEVLAEAIHEASGRAAGPFIVFDCTAVPPALLESELFGHERGSFTGATAQRKGVFEQAHGGTLLIDEIGDLDVAMQPKLLRVLERSELRRVGGDKWIRVDVRILSATRRDLDHEVQVGRFRDDLFFRIAVARVELPPLRKRRGDIPLLVRAFWKKLAGNDAQLPYETLQRFEAYAWPGNVRELFNAVARIVALGDMTSPKDVEEELAREGIGAPADFLDSVLAKELPLARGRHVVVDEFERRYVARVLEEHGGNVRKAATAAGIARRYFQLLRARQSKPQT